MKIIKGFENEDIIVSDFGEWVGKDYIDYKAEYKNSQKIIKGLLDKNKQLKDNWIELKNYLEKTIVDSMSCNTKQYYYEQVYKFVIEMEQGSDSNEC